jgi:hypothetical protein
MIKLSLKRIIVKNRALIHEESQHMRDFVHLLMKPRNTGVKWTREEINQLKFQVKHLSLYVPALIIFVLPFGSLLLPFLAEGIERRNKRRA